MTAYLRHAETLRSPDTAKHHAARMGDMVHRYTASQAQQCASAMVREMTGHYAPATINRTLGALKRALTLAWESGQTPENYGARIRRLPERNERTVYLSIEEVQRIADKASEAVRAAIWIALYTGCRRGEVCKIQREDIGEHVIRIQAGNTKTMRYREVPIAPALRPWLPHLPLSINFEGLKSGFRRARVAAGMPDVTFHDLRRSCGTILIQSGAPLHVVSKILGHTSTNVTQRRYAFLDDGQMRDAMAKVFG